MTFHPLLPDWPSDIHVEVGKVSVDGEPVFTSSGGPWSEAHRADHVIWLCWSDARFEIRHSSVRIDSPDPSRALDLFFNSVLAACHELRGHIALHGFCAATPDGDGVAVVGASGAGKTTTGLALLDGGSRLVCDDLMCIVGDTVLPGRPFVRRLVSTKGDITDAGGKVRLFKDVAGTPQRLDRVLVLDDRHDGGPVRVDSLKAVDLLLQSSHLPIHVSSEATTVKVDAIVGLLHAGLTVTLARPRSLPPSDMANLLLSGRSTSGSTDTDAAPRLS